MKRPQIKDYYNPKAGPTFEYDMTAYYDDLEEYVDFFKWHKYPDVKPVKKGKYLVAISGVTSFGFFDGEQFYSRDLIYNWQTFDAWCELPEPFEED